MSSEKSNNLERKTFLFQLNHPAHFHLFKNTINILSIRGHHVIVTNKKKDILEILLADTKHFTINNVESKTGIKKKIINLFNREVELNKVIKKFNPDLLIGTSPEIAHLGMLNRIPSVFFGEDDVILSPIMYIGALSCYPFFDTILSPCNVNNSIWNRKTVFYKGYQKLAYLHPDFFIPDRNKVDIPVGRPYFLLRFTNLSAYHDLNAKGLHNAIAKKLIDILSNIGEVLISSERPLPPEFKKYEFKGIKHHIHHYLFYSDLFIGDSQSMAVEASMLGVPNVRFSNFVGRITILEELERDFKLTKGIRGDNNESLIDYVNELLSQPMLRETYSLHRKNMLESKINVTNFFVWFIENYPNSKRIMKENPDYQYNFR